MNTTDQDQQHHQNRPSLVGYKFDPTDKELVEFYLYRKSTNTLPSIYEGVIPEFDLYGDLDPEEIWTRFHSDSDGSDPDSENQNQTCPDQNGKRKYKSREKDGDLFLFTRLKRKSSNGSRINRKVGRKGGAWQSEDAPKAIKMSCGKLGFKKRLRYELRGDEDDGGWIMHEYSLDPKLVDKENEYVLCRIRRNMNVLGNKRVRRENKGEGVGVVNKKIDLGCNGEEGGGVMKKVDLNCNVELTLGQPYHIDLIN